MNRLLIVDDEEIIVNGLYETFLGMKDLDLDIYKAYSGAEAIEWLNRTRIDIVLTDIRMPEVDGLELLKEIQKSWPQCKVIFLTGYAEFEYVYQAIQHSNVSYILKNEDREKVIKTVEDAINEINNDIRVGNLIQKAQEQMDMAREIYQRDYFLHLLKESSAEPDKEQLDKMGVPLTTDFPVILLFGNADNMPGAISYWDRIQFLYSVKLVIDRTIGAEIHNVYVMNEDYKFIMLIQPKEIFDSGDEPDITGVYSKCITYLTGMLERIQSSCRESLNASVSFSMSGEPCNWDGISGKYYSLNQILNFKIGKDMETLLVDNTVEDKMLNVDMNSGWTYRETDYELNEILRKQRARDSLAQLLESGLRDNYYKRLSQTVGPIRNIEAKSNLLANEAYLMASMSILSYINQWKLNERIPARFSLKKLTNIDRHETWSAAVDFLYELSDYLFTLQKDEQKKRADSAVDFIHKYAREHLGEDLSLVKLAEQVYLNPSYLSRLFKQVKGMNLSDYIDNMKIKMAMDMLEKDAVKIHDVAKMTGYDTAASFTRFFRKMAGCSPLEYHESYIANKCNQAGTIQNR